MNVKLKMECKNLIEVDASISHDEIRIDCKKLKSAELNVLFRNIC
jgi:hypothetical protein